MKRLFLCAHLCLWAALPAYSEDIPLQGDPSSPAAAPTRAPSKVNDLPPPTPTPAPTPVAEPKPTPEPALFPVSEPVPEIKASLPSSPKQPAPPTAKPSPTAATPTPTPTPPRTAAPLPPEQPKTPAKPEETSATPLDPAEAEAQKAEQLAKEAAEREALAEKVRELFLATASNDGARVTALLDEGIDPNVTLPSPPPPDVVKNLTGTIFENYILCEKGFTPIMIAAGLGHTEIVRTLKARGAKSFALTKKYRAFALWFAGRKNHVDSMQILLGATPETEAGRLRIHVSLADQKATLYRDGVVERTIPVSTGKKKTPTPPGRYVVTDKHIDWKSTLYPARMPFYLRLSCREFGLHAGVLPGYPASHGCIRLPPKSAKELFSLVPVGTLVEID